MTTEALAPYDKELAQAGALVCWENGDGPLRYVGPATDAAACGCFVWLAGRHKGSYASYIASDLRMARSTVRSDGWYWVRRKLGWVENKYEPWTPAEWRQESKSWDSATFSGIPESEVIVGEPLAQAIVVGWWDSNDASGIRWAEGFMRGSFEDGAPVAVLA